MIHEEFNVLHVGLLIPVLIKRHLSPLVKLCSQERPEASQNRLIQSANLHSIRLHEAINLQITLNIACLIEV